MNSHASSQRRSFGAHLRHWRLYRRLSQLALAGDTGVSTRHLSYLETDRANPSRDMVLRLTERLEVPLRERNLLLNAAGYASMYRERGLDDPALKAARQAVELILKGHEPYPALAMDRHWNLVSYNKLVPQIMAMADASLLEAPVNLLRLSLHPKGLAPHLVNLGQWRKHLFDRLSRQIAATDDQTLAQMLAELQAYPLQAEQELSNLPGELPGVVMPFRLRTPLGELNFISTITVFGTPVDVTVQELALETFFPADTFTCQVLHQMAATN